MAKRVRAVPQPSRSYNTELIENTTPHRWGVHFGTPATGLVRIEWAMAWKSVVIPCNWGQQHSIVPMPETVPLGYLVADAQNIIVASFMRSQSEWLVLIEQDNIIPRDLYLKLNEHMKKKTVPVISGLYFTKSFPSEPLIYRGRGTSHYEDWKIGDMVWCDGVPTGCLAIHRSILESMWDESQEYLASNTFTRKVFPQPEAAWFDPETGWHTASGTSDLEWCSRVIMENHLAKAGWKKLAKKPYPFLVDTTILTMHVTESGEQFPTAVELDYWSKSPGQRGRPPLPKKGKSDGTRRKPRAKHQHQS